MSENDDALVAGDLRLYVFQLGNGLMDVADEVGLMEKNSSLENMLVGLAEILHSLALSMPDKDEILRQRSKRKSSRLA